MIPALSINNRQLNRFILFLTGLVLLFMFKYRFAGESGDEYKRVVNGDGKGYYAYLPAIFIYHDMTFSFFDKDPEKFGFQYSNTFLLNHDKKNLNKYTCGTAILLLPFFLMAMLYSWFMNLPVDGYNGAFHVFCALGTLFYLVAGLFITKKILQRYGVSNIAIALALAALTIGTNLLNYVAFESSMSHVFSFFTIALHVYLVLRFFDRPALGVATLAGITLGLIILLRPINGMLILSYPFLAGSRNIFSTIKEHMRLFLYAGVAGIVVIFIQLILWKLEIGQFLVYGYKNEGFYFNRMPPVMDYLFSFKRGAFIYSPILFLCFLGLWKMRARKTETLWLLFFLVLVVYVHASWWSWYYGDGLGERPLIDFYVFFAILLAFAFDKTNRQITRAIVMTVFFVFTAFHQVFFFQYVKGIIHPYSMDFDKFRHVFMHTSDKYRNLYKCDTEDFYHPHGVLVSDSLFATLTDTSERIPAELYIDKRNIKQGQYMETNGNYPLTVIKQTDPTWLFKFRYAEIAFDFMQPNPDSSASAMLLYVTMNEKDKPSFYFNANPIEGRIYNTTNEWKHLSERIKIGTPEKSGLYVSIFLDNTKFKKICIKNFSVKIVEAKP